METGAGRIASMAAALTGVALLFISTAIAFRFGALMGATEHDGVVLGVIGVMLGVSKAVLPFPLYAAYAQGRRILLGAIAASLLCCSAYSLSSSYGYSASQRATKATAASDDTITRERIKSLSWARPAAVVEPLLAAEKDKVKQASLRSEIAAYKEASRLQRTLGGNTPTAESQISGLAAITHVDATVLRSVLMCILAAALELAELVMFWSAAVLWPSRALPRAPARSPAPQPPEPEKAPVPAPRSVRQPRRQTVSEWVEKFKGENPGVQPAEAYAKFVSDWRRRRRKPIERFAFQQLYAPRRAA